MSSSSRYSFNCDFYDHLASLVRKYQLYYYPEDNSLEMYDVKNKKMFLKRIIYPDLTLKDLFIGADISIYSRKLKVVEYSDSFTQKSLSESRNSTYGMIKPDCYLNVGKIIDYVYQSGLTISKLKMFKMSLDDAKTFYIEHKEREFYGRCTEFMSSDFSVGMEIVGSDIIKTWRGCVGPTNSSTAREQAPNSIRALFGTDNTKNAVHGSDANTSANRELDLIFGKNSTIKNIPQLSNCSCLIIKPHAIFEGHAGKIIDIVLSQGFEISCMEMFYLDKTTAEEFFEVYKGVLPEYSAIIEEVTSGPIIALEVRQENVVNSLRNLVGPHDPEIAKQLRQGTIRSMFGKDRVKNAVHCTDLADDGVLEVQYFFELLQMK